jgi:hypothetical protein
VGNKDGVVELLKLSKPIPWLVHVGHPSCCWAGKGNVKRIRVHCKVCSNSIAIYLSFCYISHLISCVAKWLWSYGDFGARLEAFCTATAWSLPSSPLPFPPVPPPHNQLQTPVGFNCLQSPAGIIILCFTNVFFSIDIFSLPD